MYFKRWKQFWEDRRTMLHHMKQGNLRYKELLSKLADLEKELQQLRQEREPGMTDAPIIIDYVHIENFRVDKIDHENNFGALGIKELSGQLNIGANYQTGVLNRGQGDKKQSGLKGLNKLDGPDEPSGLGGSGGPSTPNAPYGSGGPNAPSTPNAPPPPTGMNGGPRCTIRGKADATPPDLS